MAIVFATLNSARLSAIELQFSAAGNTYARWCHRVSELIPTGSTVLMEALPTPYFGLAPRTDVRLRLFPPRGFRVDGDRIARLLQNVDVIVAGRSLSNEPVREVVERRAIEVVDVGPNEGFAYPSRVIRLRSTAPGPANGH
jgi:hypothetical protein